MKLLERYCYWMLDHPRVSLTWDVGFATWDFAWATWQLLNQHWIWAAILLALGCLMVYFSWRQWQYMRFPQRKAEEILEGWRAGAWLN